VTIRKDRLNSDGHQSHQYHQKIGVDKYVISFSFFLRTASCKDTVLLKVKDSKCRTDICQNVIHRHVHAWLYSWGYDSSPRALVAHNDKQQVERWRI
jgi:hypothetical protein